MTFSESMTAKLRARDLRLAARLADRNSIAEQERKQLEAERKERRDIINDAMEAAALARDIITANVSVSLEGCGDLKGWRVSQHEYKRKVRRDYEPSPDRLYGGIDPGGPEYSYETVGTNELILEEQGGLWYVAHDAYLITNPKNHPPIIPAESVLIADRCTEDSFGEWSIKLASLALYNFIDNNHLAPYPHSNDSTGATV